MNRSVLSRSTNPVGEFGRSWFHRFGLIENTRISSLKFFYRIYLTSIPEHHRTVPYRTILYETVTLNTVTRTVTLKNTFLKVFGNWKYTVTPYTTVIISTTRLIIKLHGNRFNFGHASPKLLQYFISVTGIVTNNLTHFFYRHFKRHNYRYDASNACLTKIVTVPARKNYI